MNNHRRMTKRALWMMAISAPTWEEAMKYCYESKYPKKVIEGYIDDFVDRALNYSPRLSTRHY